jgi:hypothetical protein
MSINRILVVLPVLAGLVLTGTAVARMMPVQSVRDSVYQTCAHNGVHFNKQGHANCGLHKGWSDEGAGSSSGGGSGDQGDTQGGATSGDAGTQPAGPGHHHGHGHQATSVHGHQGHGSHGHSGASTVHGHSGHSGHASTHGHGRGHSKG